MSNVQLLAAVPALLAGAGLAQAQVVYTDIPDVTIGVSALPRVDVDLDLDGLHDFSLVSSANGPSFESLTGTMVAGSNNMLLEPNRLNAGDVIDGSISYQAAAAFPGDVMGTGKWSNGTEGYLGLQFISLETGQTHYGWAHIATTTNASGIVDSLTLFDYAYEATPGAAITAGVVPAPGGLAALALGAGALAGRPKRRA